MRRCPEKDNAKNDGGNCDVPTGGSPANHGRKSPSSAANHNILRRAAFQPDGVNENIKQVCNCQQGRRPVQRNAHRHHGKYGQNNPEGQLHPPPCALAEWGGLIAVHDGVDIAVVPHINGARRRPAPSAIQNIATAARKGCRVEKPGDIHIPAKPVNTTRLMTFGFNSVKKSFTADSCITRPACVSGVVDGSLITGV